MVVMAYVDALFWTHPRGGGVFVHAGTGHGSLFFLDLGGPTFAVTADHVLASYLKAKSEEPRLLCSIAGLILSPEERLIDRDPELDLATFRVSRAELARIGRRPYACPPAQWPPVPPHPEEVVFFAGFLKRDRKVRGDGSVRFRTTLVRARITDVNDRHLACTFDREDGLEFSTGTEAPVPLVLRGASGAPLWARADGPLVPWRPAGIAKKCLERHGVLVAIRPDVISTDGTLIRWT